MTLLGGFASFENEKPLYEPADNIEKHLGDYLGKMAVDG